MRVEKKYIDDVSRELKPLCNLDEVTDLSITFENVLIPICSVPFL